MRSFVFLVVVHGTFAPACADKTPTLESILSVALSDTGATIDGMACDDTHCVVSSEGCLFSVSLESGGDSVAVAWKADAFFVARGVVQSAIESAAAGLGRKDTIGCTAKNVWLRPFARVSCGFGLGKAWLTVDNEGVLSVELAPSKDVAAAREVKIDSEQLRVQSLSLDRDSVPQGAQGEETPAP